MLASIIKQVGPCRLEYRNPGFDTLVRSIVYQQLSGKVASVILNRLLDAVPRRKLTPGAVLKLAPEAMRALGLSNAKVVYIRDLAEKTRARKVLFKTIDSRSDEDVIEHLTQVKGIGIWTAHMFLMFALRRPNVLPTGDLGVRAAIRKAYGLDAMPTPKEVEAIAERWHPHCSVATWYLWRSLDGPAEL